MKQVRLRSQLAFFVASVAVAVLAVGCDSDAGESTVTVTATAAVEGTSGATLTPTPTSTQAPTVAPSATATAPAVPTATPGPPRLERFAAGEVIDVAPAVVFADPGTGEAEAWVIPGALAEMAVAPDGSYVVYQTAGREFRLLRTDDGSDRAIAADSLPLELGPGSSGFIATTQGRFVVSAFDGLGEHLGQLWLGGLSGPWSVSWSEDGELLAHALVPGGGQQTTVTITSIDGWSAVSVDAGPRSRGVSVEWSDDSQRLAVVTDDAVRVFGRGGELLGSHLGRFEGAYANPRWSNNDAYLFVDRMPATGGELAYLFTPDAEPLFRFFTPSYAGGCGGGHWLDASTIEFGGYDVKVDGTFAAHDRVPVGFYPELESYGVVVASGLGIHIPHSGVRDDGSRTSDGRLVFTTPEIGHGGCGEAWSGSSETEPEVEWPPYLERP